jgi:hypothetical protein
VYPSCSEKLVIKQGAMSLTLKPKRIFQVLNAVVILLLLAHVISQVLKFAVNSGQDFGWTHLFDLDREMNFPTYYSSTMLFVCSVLLGIIANQGRRTNKVAALYWAGLALLFLFVSVDEYSSLHEKLILLWHRADHHFIAAHTFLDQSSSENKESIVSRSLALRPGRTGS